MNKNPNGVFFHRAGIVISWFNLAELTGALELIGRKKAFMPQFLCQWLNLQVFI